MVGLALSIKHLTAETDFDSRDQTNAQGLELAEKKGTALAIRMARFLCGLDDHLKKQSHLQ